MRFVKKKTFIKSLYSKMSDAEDIATKLEEMNKKLSSMNKVVKTILEKLEQKTNYVNESEEKKRGKPKGTTFEEKQASYLEMLNGKKIKDAKQETMIYYKIQFDIDTGLYFV